MQSPLSSSKSINTAVLAFGTHGDGGGTLSCCHHQQVHHLLSMGRRTILCVLDGRVTHLSCQPELSRDGQSMRSLSSSPASPSLLAGHGKEQEVCGVYVAVLNALVLARRKLSLRWAESSFLCCHLQKKKSSFWALGIERLVAQRSLQAFSSSTSNTKSTGRSAMLTEPSTG